MDPAPMTAILIDIEGSFLQWVCGLVFKKSYEFLSNQTPSRFWRVSGAVLVR
jgi:hypothetical protein